MIEELKARFPQLFPDGGDYNELPAGWCKLFTTACEKLDALGPVSFSQVKTKFGLLRCYYMAPKDLHEMAWDIIQEAEELSEVSCEVCGEVVNPASFLVAGAYVRCPNHKGE